MGGLDLRTVVRNLALVLVVLVSAATFAVVNDLALIATLCNIASLCVLLAGLFVDFDRWAGGDRA